MPSMRYRERKGFAELTEEKQVLQTSTDSEAIAETSTTVRTVLRNDDTVASFCCVGAIT